MSAAPLVVCVHHPAAVDVERLRSAVGDVARPIEIVVQPFKESVALRRARQSPPVDAGLLAKAPVPDASILEAWARAEVLLTLDLPVAWLDRMPRLRFVQAYSAGTEHFPREALEARGIALANAAGAGAAPIAEFVFGRLVEVFRNLRGIDAMQRERAFHRPGGRSLAGCTLGIVGLGAIGTACARLAGAFGMRVVATRRSAGPGAVSDEVDALHGPEGLPRLLAESDVVVLAAPATPETEGLIDAGALARMKTGAVLCNVARGALVDEAALCAALESGRLAAAILDVTRAEPLPPDDPLWSAPNLYLSPHCSIPPDAYDERLLALFAENVRVWGQGGSLRNRVV
ncbi:MAG: D-2-hydroxyacid dehydrogenase [Myxococcota bacterium]